MGEGQDLKWPSPSKQDRLCRIKSGKKVLLVLGEIGIPSTLCWSHCALPWSVLGSWE